MVELNTDYSYQVELTVSVDGVAIQESKSKKILHQYPLHRYHNIPLHRNHKCQNNRYHGIPYTGTTAPVTH